MQQQLNRLAKLHEVENPNIYRVDVGGFKHATVPILAASLACSLRVHLSNVPEIADVRVICEILKQMGCEIQYHLENKSLIVDTTKAHFPENLDAKLINSVHGTIYLIPAMTVRFGQSSIFHAGGCAIGSATKRPVHHILEALKILGSKVLKNADEETLSQDTSEFHCVETELPLTIDVLKHLNLRDNPSGPCVSGFTKALIIAGAGLGRPLKIINYYPKRDVLELVEFLKTAGYRVNLEKHFL